MIRTAARVTLRSPDSYRMQEYLVQSSNDRHKEQDASTRSARELAEVRIRGNSFPPEVG